MIENEERFKYLLDKYLLKESTQEEFYELFDNIENDQNRKILQLNKKYLFITIENSNSLSLGLREGRPS